MSIATPSTPVSLDTPLRPAEEVQAAPKEVRAAPEEVQSSLNEYHERQMALMANDITLRPDFASD